MTFTKSLLALAFSGLLFTGCKESAKSPDAAATTDETAVKSDAPVGKLETASFHIEGMSCSVGCAKTLEKKLAGLEGVEKATVDFDKKTATVEYDTAKQSPEKLAQTVETAADGKTYKVSDVKSSGDKAMVYKDKEKKKKKKSDDKKEDKKEASTADGKKPGCCSAKKACHSDEKKTL